MSKISSKSTKGKKSFRKSESKSIKNSKVKKVKEERIDTSLILNSKRVRKHTQKEYQMIDTELAFESELF